MKNCTRDCNDAECQKLFMNSKLCNLDSVLTYVCLEDKDKPYGGIYGACQPLEMINNQDAGGWNVNPQCVDCCNTKDCNKNRDDCTRDCNDAECKANNCTRDAPYVCTDGIEGACASLPKIWQNDRNCTTCCDMSNCAGQVGVG